MNAFEESVDYVLEDEVCSPSIKEFCPQDTTQDFTIWTERFEEFMDLSHCPHSQEELHQHCLQWLPDYLSQHAYCIWRDFKNVTNWNELKQNLAEKFEDPNDRFAWKNSLCAYTWDESNVPLHMYYTRVKQFVDKFEEEMKGHPTILKGQYYTRFVCGLPGDYKNQVIMALSDDDADIDQALDVCLRYQSIKTKQNLVD